MNKFEFLAAIISDTLPNQSFLIDVSANRNCFVVLNKHFNSIEHMDQSNFVQLITSVASSNFNLDLFLDKNDVSDLKKKMITVNRVSLDLTKPYGKTDNKGFITFNYIQETDSMKLCREVNGKREKFDYSGMDFTKYPHISFLLDHLINAEQNPATDKYGKKVNLKKFTINWMAHAIQRRAKIGTSLVFVSPMQGTGKSFCVETIFKHHFGEYFTTANNDTFTEVHNAILKNKLFVMYDEGVIEQAIREKVSNKLKVAITQENIIVRQMRKDQVSDVSLFNMIINTNDKVPFKIERNDRRYTCIKSTNERLDIAVMKKLGMSVEKFVDLCKSEVSDFVLDLDNLILNTEIIRFNALMTECKKNIIRATNTKVNSIVDSINNQDIDELRNYLYDCDDTSKLEEFIEQVQLGFLTNDIVNNFLHKNLKDSDKKLSEIKTVSSARQYWDNRLSPAKPVAYEKDGKKTSLTVRTLENFKSENLTYFFSEERKADIERLTSQEAYEFNEFYEDDK